MYRERPVAAPRAPSTARPLTMRRAPLGACAAYCNSCTLTTGARPPPSNGAFALASCDALKSRVVVKTTLTDADGNETITYRARANAWVYARSKVAPLFLELRVRRLLFSKNSYAGQTSINSHFAHFWDISPERKTLSPSKGTST